MITCSRCGKENQDQYKFCLGCGAKLEAAKPLATNGEPARDAAPSGAIPLTKKAEPPAAAAGVINAAARPASAAVSPARAPGMTAAPSGAGMPSAVAATVPSSSIAVSPSAMVPAVAPAAAAPAAAAAAPAAAPAGGTVVCPKCGKTVAAAYAFCGSCGFRLKGGAAGAAAAPAAGAGAQRTMFMAPNAAKSAARGHLTLVRPDGTEGGMHPLHDGENLIGRGQGSLFDADPYLSPRHAEFVLTDEGLTVRDLRSLNGVFIKIATEERLDSGDVFRIGQELLRFEVIAPPAPMEDGTEVAGTPNPGYWGRISVIVGRDVDGPAFPLFDESIVLGRERGDILFPEDGYVSGTHAQITLRDGQVFLSDLGSSNGTFFRIRGSRVVPPGSLILMGQQLFRIAYR